MNVIENIILTNASNKPLLHHAQKKKKKEKEKERKNKKTEINFFIIVIFWELGALEDLYFNN